MDIHDVDKLPEFLGRAVSAKTPIPHILWFQAGRLSGHLPIDPRQLPPLGDRLAQVAWLAGFTAAWITATDPGQEPEGDPAAALTSLLQGHRALLAEIMAILPAAGGGRPH
jgi:hypothetical protein